FQRPSHQSGQDADPVPTRRLDPVATREFVGQSGGMGSNQGGIERHADHGTFETGPAPCGGLDRTDGYGRAVQSAIRLLAESNAHDRDGVVTGLSQGQTNMGGSAFPAGHEYTRQTRAS